MGASLSGVVARALRCGDVVAETTPTTCAEEHSAASPRPSSHRSGRRSSGGRTELCGHCRHRLRVGAPAPLWTRAASQRPGSLTSYRFHLSELRETAQRVHFDLPDALAGEPQRSADLFERLRLEVCEAVAEADHLPLALRKGGEAADESLTAQCDLHLVLG